MTNASFDLTTFKGRASFLHKTFDTESYLDACKQATERDPEAVNAAVQYANGLRLVDEYDKRLALLQTIRKSIP